jgi:hypothetical protein
MDEAAVSGLRERVHPGRLPYVIRFMNKKALIDIPGSRDGSDGSWRDEVEVF